MMKSGMIFLVLAFTAFGQLACNKKKGGTNSSIVEGTLLDNLRSESEEIDFISSQAMVVSHSTNAQGYQEVELNNGIIMIYIPAGSFVMGNNQLKRGVTLSQSSSPEHKVNLHGYWISKHPITKGQFRSFVQATSYVTDVEKSGHEGPYIYQKAENGFVPTPGYNWNNAFTQIPEVTITDDHPVTCVSWNDAIAFCNWLKTETGLNFSLPTEAEWEYAARGSDGRVYPWGNQIPDGTRANYADESFDLIFPNTRQSVVHEGVDDGYAATSPVGAFPAGASPFGVMDLAGNVTFITFDRLSEFSGGEISNPICLVGDNASEKGGMWAASAGRFNAQPNEIYTGHNIRSDARQGSPPNSADDHLGFNIVISYVTR